MVDEKKMIAERALHNLQAKTGGTIIGDKLFPLEDHLGSMVPENEQKCLVDGKWFAVRIDARQAELAKGEISERGLIPYLPLVPRRERHGRGAMRTTWRPMLCNYMFVKCELTVQHWSLIMSARGVHRLLGEEGRPMPIEEGEMEVIRLVEAEEVEQEAWRIAGEYAAQIARAGGRSGIVWHFSPRERVRIKNGPFAGFYAQLESAVDCHDRIRASVSLFGRPSVTELSAHDIERL